MSSEPSSPALADPQAFLQQEIQSLKDKLDKVNDNFLFYEESNQKLQEQVEDLTLQLDQKDLTITKLRVHIEAHKKEHEETQQENKKLRRHSSHFEDIVKANEKELKNLPELQRAIEDREAEVRNYTAELNATRTERDDKITEAKGLEGDIATLRQELDSRDQELDILHEKLDIFERHIAIRKDLPAEDLDDALYEFMEKWSAMQSDGPSPPKKNKRASISGMNLADEFEALSDDGYDSEDGGYGSDDRSIRSFVSERRAKKKAQQALGMSEIESVDIHPPIKKPIEMASAGTQMSPKPMPQNASNSTQTSPVESSKKPFTQVVSDGVQTSPIAALIQRFTPTVVNSATQTSPVPRKSFSEVVSNGVQTSPIAPVAKEERPYSEVMSSGVQTSPVAASSTKVAPRFESFTFSGTSNGVFTSPIAPSPKTAAPEAGTQTSPTVYPASSVPLPPSPASSSPVTNKPSMHAKSSLSSEVTEEQLALGDILSSQHGKRHKVNTLNIKRPRVPTKDMSPQSLKHYNAIAASSNQKNPSSDANTSTSPSPQLGRPALITTALPTFLQDITTDAVTHWRLILLWFLTSYSASYLGSSMANTAAEYSWAHSNGYAPENKYIYVGSRVPGKLVAMVWGVVAWLWNLVFGGWVLGAGSRQMPSPG